jgi:hypothetical protein
MSENKKNDHKNKKKPHEKRVISAVNHNNLDLSQYAKHDWKTEHNEHLKLVMNTQAKKENEIETPPIPTRMIVRTCFETIDRTGDEEGELLPANDPIFDSDPPVAVPLPVRSAPDNPGQYFNYVDYEVPSGQIATFSGMNLAAVLDSPPSSLPSVFTITPTPPSADPTPPAHYYIEKIYCQYDVDEDENPIFWEYETSGTYDEDPLEENAIMTWDGEAWMFFDGPTGVPCWVPADNDPWDEGDPGYKGPDGEDGYPNGTLDMYKPLYKYLPHHTETIIEKDENGEDVEVEVEVYEITFSFEKQCFNFAYEQQTVNGVTKWVMVIRPMRRKKKQ